jgi:D-3-phosphoglycerate dehydrogenase/C-terminal binding protein
MNSAIPPYRVAITDCLAPPATIEDTVLAGLAHVECLQARSVADLKNRLSPFHGLLVYHDVSLPAELIAELDQCRVIVRCGVGYDNIDLAAAGRRGIPVCNVPDYGVDEVADHAIGMMLACTRGFLVAERRLRHTLSPWDRHALPIVQRLTGATLGVVGCGRIGTATALRAKALNMQVLICDPYLPPGTEKALGVTRTDLRSLLGASDVVSLHTPLTEETRGLLNSEMLALMKPTAFLVNTARGAVVDIGALADALRRHAIAGAAIDVFPSEPPSTDNPLIRLWQEPSDPPINLVITPHVAYYSDPALTEMRTRGAEEAARVLRNQPPRCCVNQPWLRVPPSQTADK